MKRRPILTLFAVVLAGLMVAVLLPSEPVDAGIAGTKHDLSGKGWGSTQLCVFCHTPHNSMTGVAGAPLWNHTITAATFGVYTSSTLNATVGQPAGNSKLCLSCHDGTVALDSFGGATGSNMISGAALVGTALGNDHPVSFTYDASLASTDGGLATPVSSSYVDAASKLPLFSGQMQCASCHSVHDDTNGNFLRIANTGSALCLTCHTK